MTTVIKQRRGTTAQWASADAASRFLADGEVGFNTDTKEQRVGTGSAAWSTLPVVGSATFGLKGRKAITVYDDFSAAADGALVGRIPILGNAWQATGAQGTTIASGKISSTGTGYAWQNLGAQVGGAACEVVWSGSGTNSAMTIGLTSGAAIDLNNIAAHFNFGPAGFNLTVRKDAGTFDSILSGVWRKSMKVDGATKYRLAVHVRGQTVIATGPFGEVFAVVDSRVEQLLGQVVFWEPNGGTPNAGCVTVGAYPKVTSGAYGALDMGDVLAGAGLFAAGSDSVAGGRDTAYQVTISGATATSLPTILFGGARVLTALNADVAIGDTSISTNLLIPNGSTIQIESGTGSETVTASANSSYSAGIYTTPISALTKVHTADSAVVATIPAGWRAQLTVNNGALTLPAGVILGQYLYMPGQTAYIAQANAGVVQVAGAGAGKGAFKTGSGTTAGRPTAAAAGAGSQWYDTSIGKPIWSDGINWKDASGTTV